ncbi:hypothetical protein VIM7927_01642 [Vibrio mangrovi]|uniref:Uncharacterized protein n=1 Tax=Vibrio mangrovi TaxID=474394 RepID=A0A1Y6IU92_9VIBR|nr:hypothetical protein VIM7927_01642 [Vibrio mangrovi]
MTTLVFRARNRECPDCFKYEQLSDPGHFLNVTCTSQIQYLRLSYHNVLSLFRGNAADYDIFMGICCLMISVRLWTEKRTRMEYRWRAL